MASTSRDFDNGGACLASCLAQMGLFSDNTEDVQTELKRYRECNQNVLRERDPACTLEAIERINGSTRKLERGFTISLLKYALHEHYGNGNYVFTKIKAPELRKWTDVAAGGETVLIDGELNKRWLCANVEYEQSSKEEVPMLRDNQAECVFERDNWRHVACVKNDKFWCSNEEKWYNISELHLNANDKMVVKKHRFASSARWRGPPKEMHCGYFMKIHKVYRLYKKQGVPPRCVDAPNQPPVSRSSSSNVDPVASSSSGASSSTTGTSQSSSSCSTARTLTRRAPADAQGPDKARRVEGLSRQSSGVRRMRAGKKGYIVDGMSPAREEDDVDNE